MRVVLVSVQEIRLAHIVCFVCVCVRACLCVCAHVCVCACVWVWVCVWSLFASRSCWGYSGWHTLRGYCWSCCGLGETRLYYQVQWDILRSECISMHAADIHEKALFFIFLVASLSFCKNQHAKNPSSRNLKANQHMSLWQKVVI